jgi:hypothetical protein
VTDVGFSPAGAQFRYCSLRSIENGKNVRRRERQELWHDICLVFCDAWLCPRREVRSLNQ